MEAFIAGLLIGVAGATFVLVSAMRRAKAKPDGKTAKVISIVGG